MTSASAGISSTPIQSIRSPRRNNTTAGTELGIPTFDGDSKYNNPGIPDFNITGFNGFGSAGTNWYQNDSTHQISEQISWIAWFPQHHGRRGVSPTGHRPGGRQQRARHIFIQRNAVRLCAGRFHLRAPGKLRHGRSGNPRTRRRVARRLLRSRQVAGLAQTDSELWNPLRAAHGALHDQRRTRAF